MRANIWFLGLLLWTACRTTPPVPPPEPILPAARVFILNEGNFQRGNASLDMYDPSSGQLETDVFARLNMEPVGDVLQSLSQTEDALYLVVNNSQHIKVLDPETLALTGRIDSLTSPRYMLPIQPNKAYVSDLYADALSVVDLAENRVSARIPLRGWTEAMVQVANRVWVTNLQRPFLYVIDVETDQIVDSLALSAPASQILVDRQGMVWAAAPADAIAQSTGAIFQIDPVQQEILHQFDFPTETGPSAMVLHPTQDSLYYLSGAGVFVLDKKSTELPPSPFIAAGDALFYGLGVDPSNGDIYLADAIDYVQKGVVLRYTAAGELLAEFRTGIIPGYFAFDRE